MQVKQGLNIGKVNRALTQESQILKDWKRFKMAFSH